MPTSFAMAVFADFGWAQIDVMRPSDNILQPYGQLFVGSWGNSLPPSRYCTRQEDATCQIYQILEAHNADNCLRVECVEDKDEAGDLLIEDQLAGGGDVSRLFFHGGRRKYICGSSRVCFFGKLALLTPPLIFRPVSPPSSLLFSSLLFSSLLLNVLQDKT
jgi:hypothetical protein